MQRRLPKRQEFPFFGPEISLDPELKIEGLIPGCPRPDCIPSIDKPIFLNVNEAIKKYQVKDMVLGTFTMQDNQIKEAFAFPINILNFHEIVNFSDSVGTPLAITYCPLCSTSAAYVRQIDGNEIVLGVSGLLYNSALVLYDRNSMSLISQVWSRGITGKLVSKEIKQQPVLQTTLEQWIQAFPDSKILSPETGMKRYYERYKKNPYLPYFEDQDSIRFPLSNEIDEKLPKKELVYIVKMSKQKAFILAKDSLKNEKEKINEFFAIKIAGSYLFFNADPGSSISSLQLNWNALIKSEISFYFSARSYYPHASLLK